MRTKLAAAFLVFATLAPTRALAISPTQTANRASASATSRSNLGRLGRATRPTRLQHAPRVARQARAGRPTFEPPVIGGGEPWLPGQSERWLHAPSDQVPGAWQHTADATVQTANITHLALMIRPTSAWHPVARAGNVSVVDAPLSENTALFSPTDLANEMFGGNSTTSLQRISLTTDEVREARLSPAEVATVRAQDGSGHEFVSNRLPAAVVHLAQRTGGVVFGFSQTGAVRPDPRVPGRQLASRISGIAVVNHEQGIPHFTIFDSHGTVVRTMSPRELPQTFAGQNIGTLQIVGH